ncbi:hypothetical protein FZW96_00800 [Bacillus sp. BGMRC 2118]|nr:hypothetical protein FZW96_00800 [Bacillus sp. BGMRC 2118]
MEATILIILMLTVFLLTRHKQMDKKERVLVYTLSLFAAGLSLLFVLPFSLNRVTVFVNNILSPIAKMVIS